jgi:hypothetical protein
MRDMRELRDLRALRAVTLPLVLAGLAAAAHADPRNELSIGGAARALRSSSANAITDRNLGGASVGAAHDLGVDLGPASLWASAGLTTGSTEGAMFRNVSTKLEALALTGGLGARLALHRLITLSARIELGAQRVRLDIDDGSASVSDHAWGRMAAASVALDLIGRPGSRLGFGFRVEAGYAMTEAIGLSPQREVPGDALLLPMSDASIGNLDLGGPTLAASLVGQF